MTLAARLMLFCRSLLFQFGYVLATAVISIACMATIWFLPKRLRFVFASSWCSFILFWLRLTLGVRYEIRGLENIPGTPVVALANHQSEWETFLLYKVLAPVCPILKRELLSIPFWGWALRFYHPIAIDRSKPHEAGRSILTQGVERIREGMSVVIFPEGTRTPVGRHKPFSRGGAKLAVAAATPILPVAHNAGRCWPPHRFLKQRHDIRVVIGEPVPTAGADASVLTEQVEQWVRQQEAGWISEGDGRRPA